MCVSTPTWIRKGRKQDERHNKSAHLDDCSSVRGELVLVLVLVLWAADIQEQLYNVEVQRCRYNDVVSQSDKHRVCDSWHSSNRISNFIVSLHLHQTVSWNKIPRGKLEQAPVFLTTCEGNSEMINDQISVSTAVKCDVSFLLACNPKWNVCLALQSKKLDDKYYWQNIFGLNSQKMMLTHVFTFLSSSPSARTNSPIISQSFKMIFSTVWKYFWLLLLQSYRKKRHSVLFKDLFY